MNLIVLVGWYLLAGLLHLIALPYLIWRSRQEKYHLSLPARFWKPASLKKPSYDLWIHACSLGEVKAAAAIVDEAKARGLSILITVMTQTGYEEAKRYKGVESHFLPFETFLPWWAPQVGMLVVVEAEIWPILFWSARLRGARVVMASARISDRSWAGYRRLSFLYRAAFAACSYLLVQRPIDHERFLSLGAHDVRIAGNIKALVRHQPTRFYPKQPGLTIVGASTHEGEEIIIFEAWRMWRAQQSVENRLWIVPRHPERFKAVAFLLQERAQQVGLSFGYWQEGGSAKSDVVLVDRMGELLNIYAISDLVILGGAFVPVGGHNLLEPVVLGCRVVTGEHLFNQEALLELVEGVIVTTPEQLAQAIDEALLLPPPRLKVEADYSTLWRDLDGLVHA
ncbi:MAG: 3-deoxy-D-manno-octulosonic acid transferase [Campylobacterales bacterium]